MTTVQYTAYNNEDGVQAEVTIGDLGYHVVLFDLDAGEYVPTAKAFPTFERARAYADQLVGC